MKQVWSLVALLVISIMVLAAIAPKEKLAQSKPSFIPSGTVKITAECVSGIIRMEAKGKTKAEVPLWLEIEVQAPKEEARKFILMAGLSDPDFYILYHRDSIGSLRQGREWNSGQLSFVNSSEYILRGYKFKYTEGFPKLNSKNKLFEQKFQVPRCGG